VAVFRFQLNAQNLRQPFGGEGSSLFREGVTLSGRLQVWQQFQNLRFARQAVRVFGIQCHALQFTPDPQFHQVVAYKLWSGQALALGFIQLPGPGVVLVGDAFFRIVPIRFLAGQHIPDQGQQTPGNGYKGLVAVHASFQAGEQALPVRVGFHRSPGHFHHRSSSLTGLPSAVRAVPPW
jgi:hypothetical protein